jgi:multidrug efflux pump subunit AcrB
VGRESPNFAQGIVQLRLGIESNQAIQNLQQKLSAAFGQALVLVRQVEQGPAFNAPVKMRLYGTDLAQLQTLGDRLRWQLAQVQSVIQTRATISEALPKLALSLDEEQVRLIGLDKSAIAQQLDRILEGTVGGSVLEGTEEIPVRVRLSQSDRADLDLVRSQFFYISRTNCSCRTPLKRIGIPCSLDFWESVWVYRCLGYDRIDWHCRQ